MHQRQEWLRWYTAVSAPLQVLPPLLRKTIAGRSSKPPTTTGQHH